MSPADWIILALVVLNVVSAAMQGFFAEALSMAGLIVGYIVAAWQYQRLSIWLESFLKNEWLAEILGFLVIFFAIVLVFGIAGRIGSDPDGIDGIYTHFENAGELSAGALFSGRGPCRHLGSAGGTAGPLLSGSGPAASGSAKSQRKAGFSYEVDAAQRHQRKEKRNAS